MKSNAIALAIVLALLTACAAPSTADKASETRARLIALYKAKNDVPVVIGVPSTDSTISNMMIVTSIKGGADAKSVVDLVAFLKNTNGKSVAVIGNNDDITAAVVEASIKRLQGFKPATKLYFVGDASHGQALKAQADAAGVNFEAIAYP